MILAELGMCYIIGLAFTFTGFLTFDYSHIDSIEAASRLFLWPLWFGRWLIYTWIYLGMAIYNNTIDMFVCFWEGGR